MGMDLNGFISKKINENKNIKEKLKFHQNWAGLEVHLAGKS